MIKKTKTFRKLENNPISNTPKEIILHHTGGTDVNPLADASHHSAEIVENWHLAKGWLGIGYHFYIAKDGSVSLGRPQHVSGAHTIGKNSSSLGICMAGNFDATLPTKEQEMTFKELYLELNESHAMEFEVSPHRAYANKSCYGNKLPNDYGQALADRAMEQAGPEIEDDSEEAIKFLEKENERLKKENGFFKQIIKLLLAWLQK